MRISMALVGATAFFINIASVHAQKIRPAGPHLLVYKTKANYLKLVPVTLSTDKKTVVNYPDPADIKSAGTKCYPSKLHKGYLLDNRGISHNTVFLDISYADYATYKEAPTPDKLQSKIVAKDPLTVLYDCGLRSEFKNPVADINKLIDNGLLSSKCKVLKKPRK